MTEAIQSGEAGQRGDLLDRIYAAMRERGLSQVRPTRFITSSKEFDLSTISPEDELQMAESQAKRPFWLMEGAHPDHRLVLTKIRRTEDLRGEGQNERVFYQQMRDELLETSPPAVKAAVDIPKFKAEGEIEGGLKFFQSEFVEGQKIGDHSYEATNSSLSVEDFRNIAAFIKHFQTHFSPQYVVDRFPEIKLNSEGGCPTHARTCQMIKEHETEYREWLGDELFDNAQQILIESERLFQQAPWVFTNVDINVSNLVRNTDGKITIFDWERLKLINNPAAAYSYIPAAHWHDRALQAQMFKEAMNLNTDIDNFDQLLKVNVMFYRYMRVPMVHFWLRRQRGELAEEQQAQCAETLESFKQLLQEAVDGQGVWRENGSAP